MLPFSVVEAWHVGVGVTVFAPTFFVAYAWWVNRRTEGGEDE